MVHENQYIKGELRKMRGTWAICRFKKRLGEKETGLFEGVV